MSARTQYLVNQEATRLKESLIQKSFRSDTTQWETANKQVVDTIIAGATLTDGEPHLFGDGSLFAIKWKKIGPSVYAIGLKRV